MKKLLLIVLTAGLLFSCQKEAGHTDGKCPHSVDSKATEKEISDLLNKFAEDYSSKNLNAGLAYYEQSKDIIAVGSGIDEEYIGIEALKKALERDFIQAEKIEMKNLKIHVNSNCKQAWFYALQNIKIISAGIENNMKFRLSGLATNKKGKWLFQMTHIGLVSDSQQAGNSWPGQK